MELKDLVCANSPVWERNGFSECFSNMVLGFGGNVMTVILILVAGILQRNGGRSVWKQFWEKFTYHFIPAFGVFMSSLDVILILTRAWNDNVLSYHNLIFRWSRVFVWVIVLLLSWCECWYLLFSGRILCFWWIVKPLVQVPHLQLVLSSSEAFQCLEESSIVLLDLIFGICLYIARIKQNSCAYRFSLAHDRCIWIWDSLAFSPTVLQMPHLYSLYDKSFSLQLIRKDSLLEDPFLSNTLDLEEGHVKDPGTAESIWAFVTFNTIKSVMDRGVTKQLDFNDLLSLPADMDPSACHDVLLTSWQAHKMNNCSNPSFFKAMCFAYGWPYLRLGLLKVINDSIGFAGPLLLNKLIQYLQRGSKGVDGYALAMFLGVTAILKSFLDTQYTYRLSKLKLKLRSGIMTVIYQKCLSVSLAERSKFSEGEIQTFMSVDADRISNLCNSFHDMWSLPFQIGVALCLLYTQVNFAFLSGTAVTVLLIPVNKWISKLIANATENMMKQKDERIRRTGELLTHIRTLKMYGWELLFSDWVMETRCLEVQHLATRKYLDAWCVFFWATTPTLFSLSTFGLFTLMGHQLDSATVFTCLALFNTLISPLNSFPWVINGLIDAIISSSRLSRFLACSEIRVNVPCSTVQTDDTSDNNAVVVQDACLSWSSDHNGERCFMLDHISLSLPKGSFVVIIGEVGSGKSSLLNSILKEMQIIQGIVHLNGSVAYVPQVPWIHSGTIRENILFGNEYNPQRYTDVLRACALELDISLMAGADMAYIGDKGTNLSGGQRARVALARAIYNAADVILFDDVLSAVDAHVSRCIINNVILGPFISKKTRILCTHNLQAISSADIVVMMEKGHVKFIGNPANLAVSSCSEFSSVNPSHPSFHENQQSSLSYAESEENLHQGPDHIQASEEAQEIVHVEKRNEGKVELAVYSKYAGFSGWFITGLILVSAILMQASRNGNDIWLSYWVDTTKGSYKMNSLSFYLVVLSIFCAVNSILTLVRAFSFAFGGLRAAIRVHNTLLSKLVHSPVNFFDCTPRGRILNRLSSDLYTIDDSLPFIMNILLANFVGLGGIALVLSYVQVIFLLLLLPFWYIYRKLQFYYRSTSRELRRLDSVSRSPIYAYFTETLDGSSTIRAFNSVDLFFTKFTDNVAMYQKTSYSEITASLWLSLRLQCLVAIMAAIGSHGEFPVSLGTPRLCLAAFIISLVAIMAVVGSHGELPISLGTPGLVGLALSYAAPIVSSLGNFLTSFTETEKEMVAVERFLQYMECPQEEFGGSQSLLPDWPFQGQIQFHNVTLRYLPSLPAALSDVTFTIEGGTQVGIIGRTGAGKSSILNALFHLSPICGGHILVDGMNIDDIPVRELRLHLAVVPQSPFLFQGSLRDNLDPFQMNDDVTLWEALEKCRIKEEVERTGGLDVHIKDSGSPFSVGQRQLICLARAFLKSSKVLCLDECTANVDGHTASVIQNVISRECRSMTVITIAHRISTVLNMDNILVLEQGRLVEQGNPHILLLDEGSRLSAFTRASST